MQKLLFSFSVRVILACLISVAPALEWISALPLATMVNNSTTVNGQTYIASRNEGLLVVDVSNPGLPQMQPGFDPLREARAVEVSGNYAYIADNGFGLKILDVSDPSGPQLAGELELEGPTTSGQLDRTAYGIFLTQNYALIEGLSYFSVVDVTDPTSPQFISRLSGVGLRVGRNMGQKLVAAGDYAYILADSVLYVVGLVDPAQPQLAHTLNFDGIIQRDIALLGNHICLVSLENGLEIYSLTSPQAPTLVSRSEAPAGGQQIEVVGNTAYVSGNAIQVFEVSDPTAPVFEGMYSLAGSLNSLSYDQGTMIAANSTSLQTLAVEGRLPPVVSNIDLNRYYYRVSRDGNRVAATSTGGGFSLLNIENPQSPIVEFERNPNFFIEESEVVLKENRMYTVNYFDLEIWNLADSSQPFLEGSHYSTGVKFFAIDGELAYLAGDSFMVADVTDPATTQRLFSAPLPSAATSIQSHGSQVYITGAFGLIIYDVSNPGLPQLVSELAGPVPMEKICIGQNFVFLAGKDSTLYALNLATYQYPDRLTVPLPIFDMELAGDRLYLATGSSLILTINVSDPENLSYGPRYYSWGQVQDMEISESHIYAAEGWAGLTIVSLESPLSIQPPPGGGWAASTTGFNPLFEQNSLERVRVSWQGSSIAPWEVAIYNIRGKQVFTAFPRGQSYLDWPTESISPGNYYIRFASGPKRATFPFHLKK